MVERASLDVASTLETIERHGAFRLPAAYRRWATAGRLDPHVPSALRVYEATWLAPEVVPFFELAARPHLEGLVPFALTGAGDLWCWYAAGSTPPAEPPILLCYHDDPLARLYAPTFTGWFYRSCLEFARNLDKTPPAIAEARGRLADWALELQALGHPDWSADLRELATRPTVAELPYFGFLNRVEYDARVSTAFGPDYLLRELTWFDPEDRHDDLG
jgi:hypothetical protein